MKVLLCLVTVLASLQLHAASAYKVYTNDSNEVSGKYRNISFGADVNGASAWVSFSYEDATCSDADCLKYVYRRAYVSGLRYDIRKGQIVFERDGRSVVCAKAKVKNPALSARYVKTKSTGKCDFSQSKRSVTGFYGNRLQKRKERSLYLVVM